MLIKDIKDRDQVHGIYLCKQKTSAKTKAGKTYYSLILQDKSGTLDGKIWELSNSIGHFESMDFICVDGDVTTFNDTLQLRICRVRKADEGEYRQEDYFPVSPNDVEKMFEELLSYVNSLKNPHLKKLAESFFKDDKELVKQFKQHSAAKSMHHGFVGGLLHHTLSVVKLCDGYCTLYPWLKRDLLLTAAMLHDIGKLRELSAFPINDYTDDGQLLGHIVIGYEMVGAHIAKIPGFPEKTASELKHCILSHHGEFEYGSPKKPAIAEAVALNFADNTDAKLEMMYEALGDSTGEWMGFHRGIDSNIRKSSEV